MSRNIESFWNDCHKKDVIESLSGCTYDETVIFLQVGDRVKPGISVLEIGVGMGYVTKGLFEKGAAVDCLDISKVALERVQGYCRKTFHVSEIQGLPTDFYDLVICHNVVQHVPTNELVPELTAVIRALKEGGLFSVEFVSTDNVDDAGINPTISDAAAGKLSRSPKFMMDMIEKCGGRSTLAYDAKVESSVISGVHVLHVCRAFGSTH